MGKKYFPMAADDDCHFAITAVTSDFWVARGAPWGAVGLCWHSSVLPLLLALLGAGGMGAHVEDLIALSKEADGHEILSEEEQHCPAPAVSLVVDKTRFPSPSLPMASQRLKATVSCQGLCLQPYLNHRWEPLPNFTGSI